jgi:hypothetical protein
MRKPLLFVIALLAFGLVACEPPSPEGDSEKTTQKTQEASANKAADHNDEGDKKLPDEETEPTSDDDSEQEASEFTGEVERGAILEGDERWAQRYEQAEVDEDVAEALGEVDPGARVEIYLGVWCEDSMREVPRFWRAFDAAGMVPFEIKHIGLNREFSAGDVSLEGLDIEAVPTFIVYRDGEEVGRVVENSPENIETHLLALLTGEASGVISASR